MEHTHIRKMIGSFVFVIAICFLLLSVFEITNKADHINEYNSCVLDYETAPVTSEIFLNECKEVASQGLGITIRPSQIHITTTQYMYIYLKGLINVLLAVILSIIGQAIYASGNKKTYFTDPIKEEKKLKKKIRKK